MITSIVIVSYKSEDLLLQCIKSLINNTSYDLIKEIIIVNNDKKNISNLNNKKINVIEINENLGYSKAVNIGIKICTTDLIITLNPDTIVLDDIIKINLELLNDDKVGIVGCKILNNDGTYQSSSMRRFPHIFVSLMYFFKLHKIGFKNYYKYGDLNNDQNNYVDSLSGSCMMCKKEIFNLIGGFNEKYFLYFEDTQFCYDINNKGYYVLYNSNTKIKHLKGGSFRKSNKFFKYFIFHSSLIKFISHNINEYKMFLFNSILFVLIMLIIFTN